MSFKISEIKALMKKYERWVLPVALLVGFIVDNLTLTRVDKWFDNIILFWYIVLASTGILILYAKRTTFTVKPWFVKLKVFTPLIVQYAFGGLFSGLVIFYFRSGSIFTSFPFLIVLFLLFLANDYLHGKYQRLTFQLVIFYVALFSYFTLVTPIITREISVWIFLLGTAISIIVMYFYLKILAKVIPEEDYIKNKNTIEKTILATASIFVILYFINVIPPIPLSMKDGVIARNVTVSPEKIYSVTVEKPSWWQIGRDFNKTIHHKKGEPIYAFSSVFAPTKITGTIYHEWSRFDPSKNRWVESDRIPINIIGGRDGGSRGFSFKGQVQDGLWRVNIESESGQVIGRFTFKISSEATNNELEVLEY